MPRIVKVILVVLALVGVYYAYGYFFGGGGAGMQGGAPPVSVAQVIERQVVEWNEFSGRLSAVNQVELHPRVSGTIDSVHFQNGAEVKEGDLLFVIDPRPYEAALQSAAAQAGFAETEYKRAKKLVADKAISQRDYDSRRNAVEVARAALATAKLNLDYTQIRAPIAGRVGRAEITVGNLVDAGANAPILTTVVSSAPIYADFDMDERMFLKYARAGKDSSQVSVELGLTSETGTPHQGRIESFDNQLSTTSGTIRVRAVFENADGALLPGLFARIRLGIMGDQKSILINERAVGTDQNKKFVLVVGTDNTVAYREIILGSAVGNLRIVSEGLKPGEKIVVNGLQRAHPGAPVTPEIVPMDAIDTPPAAPAADKTPS